MTLVELRCTTCNAPLGASDGRALTCRYCGAVLVRADAPGAVSAAVAAVPDGSVFLEDIGNNKIGVIKVVREFTDRGLKESMLLVEDAPCELASGLDGARAKAFRSALIAEGARVRT
jgi:large subunit ribosomal protein L7/L12